MTQDLVPGFNALVTDTIPIVAKMGIEFTVVAPGVAQARAPFEGNGNHLGTMYAGVLFTVAELLGGALVIASFDAARFAPVVKDMRIDFKLPVKSDVLARAELSAEQITQLTDIADRDGKAQFDLVATVHDLAGTLVAETVGTYQLRQI